MVYIDDLLMSTKNCKVHVTKSEVDRVDEVDIFTKTKNSLANAFRQSYNWSMVMVP